MPATNNFCVAGDFLWNISVHISNAQILHWDAQLGGLPSFRKKVRGEALKSMCMCNNFKVHFYNGEWFARSGPPLSSWFAVTSVLPFCVMNFLVSVFAAACIWQLQYFLLWKIRWNLWFFYFDPEISCPALCYNYRFKFLDSLKFDVSIKSLPSFSFQMPLTLLSVLLNDNTEFTKSRLNQLVL